MKKLLAILSASILVACADHKCIIEGNITGLEGDGWIHIQDAWDNYRTIDSTTTVDGSFRFELEDPQITFAYLYYNQEVQLHNLMIEPGKIKVQGDVEDAWSLRGIGTPMNDRYDALIKDIEAMNSAKEKQRITMERLREDLSEGKGEEYRLLVIENSFTSGIHPVELLEYFGTLKDPLKSASHSMEIKEYLQRLALVYPQTEGSDIVPRFIDMTYPDANGNQISLGAVIKNAANRYVLLDFWATWCEPCRDEMPFVKSAYDRYKGKGFEIYAVSCDPSPDNWKAYIEDEELEWTNVIAGNFRRMPEAESYALDGIPSNILIDCSTGVIVGRDLRGEALMEKLNGLL